jgi:Aldehyde dehydrogenase family
MRREASWRRSRGGCRSVGLDSPLAVRRGNNGATRLAETTLGRTSPRLGSKPNQSLSVSGRLGLTRLLISRSKVRVLHCPSQDERAAPRGARGDARLVCSFEPMTVICKTSSVPVDDRADLLGSELRALRTARMQTRRPRVVPRPSAGRRGWSARDLRPCLLCDAYDDDEVLARSNDTADGLRASIRTRDVGRAHRLEAATRVGNVWVNLPNPLDAAAPRR